MKVRDQVSVFNAVAHRKLEFISINQVLRISIFFFPLASVEPGRGSSEFEGRDDETSSTSSEKYERDVTVLNHCFDDIEKFIARLQHAAAASRELERRQKYVPHYNRLILQRILSCAYFLGVGNQKRKI